MINIELSLKNLPRISPDYHKVLEKLGLHTVQDLLFYFPFRYNDFSQNAVLDEKYLGQTITVEGVVSKIKLVRIFKRKLTIAEVILQDENGALLKAVWFNQPFILNSVKEGALLRVSGKLALDKKLFSMSNPAWEMASRESTNTGRLVPVYSETKGITSKWIRWQIKIILKNIEKIPETLPEETRKKFSLPDIQNAITQIHFPDSTEKLQLAQKRFAFENMLLAQIKALQTKSLWEKNNSLAIKFDENLIKTFVEKLPFKLTNAQRKASFEILKDLEKPRPMNRLLNGDVGSGKTIVAAISTLQAIAAGYQVALMAPTEILARQHFLTFSEIFKNYEINIALLTGKYREINKSEIKNSKLEIDLKLKIKNLKLQSKHKIITNRKELLREIEIGNVNLVVGTHALIQKDVKFKNLALVIIDEQHRFGVAQRATLLTQTYADLERTNAEGDDKLLYKELTYKVRGAVFQVKKQLGLGHKENIYQKALEEEFKNLKLNFSKEKSIDIKYNDKKIGTYRPDFIIENKIILELKALPSIGKFEKQQVWHYLKGSDYKLALLVNFGREDIKIERFIHSSQHESVSSPHKSASMPHLLTMTATPIPRTLAIAFFGSLSLSILDEMPKNRKPIITKIIPPAARNSAYEFVRREIKRGPASTRGNSSSTRGGRQVFIVLPLIEESESLAEVKAAKKEYERLSKEVFPDLKLGLLHGKLKSEEKEKAMKDFSEKKTDILVSTPVVEVGIDIPNATLMIIENAERFGLSQLHQFRGRVGRGENQSYCFLFSESDSERLKTLEKNNDGFAIAEKDLQLRGPGQFFGTLQSGLPDIAMENLGNLKLIKFAREEAKEIIQKDPQLKNHPAIRTALQKFEKQVHLE